MKLMRVDASPQPTMISHRRPPEFPRNIYSDAGPRSNPELGCRVEMVNEFVGGLRLNAKEILTRKSVSEPHDSCDESQGERPRLGFSV
jgi:hypothetical protein